MTSISGFPRISHRCDGQTDGYSHLMAHVATNAYNLKDLKTCYKGTRDKLLHDILLRTFAPQERRLFRILWITGQSGVGKSAMIGTIITTCVAKKFHMASFIFSKKDSTRNSLRNVVPTLVHQVIGTIRDLKEPVSTRIARNSLIFQEHFKPQLDYLLRDTLDDAADQMVTTPTLLLVFDGMDECLEAVDRGRLIEEISAFVCTTKYPVVAIFSSRPETSTIESFKRVRVKCQDIGDINLDSPIFGTYGAIRAFAQKRLEEIAQTHPTFATPLIDTSNWNPHRYAHMIARRSYGNFIFASAIIRCCSTRSTHPGRLLQAVLEGRETVERFYDLTWLDCVFYSFFETLYKVDARLLILACLVHAPSAFQTTTLLCKFFRHGLCAEFDGLRLFLGVDRKSREVGFRFANFPAFLKDPQRSKKYCVNSPAIKTELCCTWFYHARNGNDRDWNYGSTLRHFLKGAYLSEALDRAISEFDPSTRLSPEEMADYTTIIRELKFNAVTQVHTEHFATTFEK